MFDISAYDAVAFDFDYTLGDTTQGIVESMNYALRGLGWPEASEQDVRPTIGHSLQYAYERLTGDGEAGMAARFVELFLEQAARCMAEGAVFLPGARELLDGLRARGVRMALVTTKHRAQIQRVLRSLSAEDMFDVVLGEDDVAAPKPDPEGLLRAAALLGGARTLYVGDSTVDAEAAMRAGVDFLGVSTGATPAEALAAYPHAAIVASLGEAGFAE